MQYVKKRRTGHEGSGQKIERAPSDRSLQISQMTEEEKGRWGEEATAVYYQSRGFQVLERNYRSPFGEIDLIVSREDCLRFVEVKARTSSKYGRPADFVDRRKRDRIRRTAFHFLSRQAKQGTWTYYLFDVVEVNLREKTIHRIPNAFALKEGA